MIDLIELPRNLTKQQAIFKLKHMCMNRDKSLFELNVDLCNKNEVIYKYGEFSLIKIKYNFYIIKE